MKEAPAGVEKRSKMGRISAYSTSLCLIVLGCGPSAAYRPGVSDKPHGIEAPPQAEPLRGVQTWEYARADMHVLSEPFVSRGHRAGEWTAEVRANDAAVQALSDLRPGGSMPEGAVLAQVHQWRANTSAAPIFAMHKRQPGFFPAGGDWEFMVVGSDGTVRERGKLASCARCHAEAPSDFVFVPFPSGNGQP